MTLQSELTETAATAANGTPRGGSYVTLPAGPEVSAQPEGSYVTLPTGPEVSAQLKGSYVSLPGALPGNGSRAQGTYVTVSGQAGD